PQASGRLLRAGDPNRSGERRRQDEPRARAALDEAGAGEVREGRAQWLRLRARPRCHTQRQRLLMGGVSFLTPLDALFALAAALPLAALLAMERRSGRIRQMLSLPPPRRLAALPVAVALVTLTSLVAVAAAQPVVVQQRLVQERADAQAFFVFDTSLSMKAS